MQIRLTGIDHQTAPVAVRERVAIGSGGLEGALQQLRSHTARGVILATCNRTEIYTVGESAQAGLDFLRARLTAPGPELDSRVYRLDNGDAVAHLFRVAGGLESMLVGEHEVLGQVRQALAAAEAASMVNLPLRRIFQAAVRTGRRIREETGIGRNALSVSSVAVDLAAGAVGDLSRCALLLIGTGEAGRLVARAAGERGVSRTVVAGRTVARASGLAVELGGVAVGTESLESELAQADIVITCSGAPHRVFGVGQVKRAMAARPERPLVIIDIAVPRNVEPSVARVKNVSLHDIDAITGLAEANREQRGGEMEPAARVVAEELEKFAVWWQEYKVRPLIKAMTGKAETIRRTQLERAVKKLPQLGEAERRNLELMTKAIVSKILKDPIDNIKANGHRDRDYSEIARHLFRLDIEDK